MIGHCERQQNHNVLRLMFEIKVVICNIFLFPLQSTCAQWFILMTVCLSTSARIPAHLWEHRNTDGFTMRAVSVSAQSASTMEAKP